MTAPADPEPDAILYVSAASTTLDEAGHTLASVANPLQSANPEGPQTPMVQKIRGPHTEKENQYSSFLEECSSGMCHSHHNTEEAMAHYFGCLRSSEKPKFLNELADDRLKQLISDEERRVTKLRSLLDRMDSKESGDIRAKLLKSFASTLSHFFPYLQEHRSLRMPTHLGTGWNPFSLRKGP
jgi:hypothetical protein